MFEEPEQEPAERPSDPSAMAQEKADAASMHAELAAVFEGCRKFDAQLYPGFDPQLVRDIQRGIGKLEKAKSPDSPVLPPASASEAAELLNLPTTRDLPTNDYHIHRRPGEVMIVRWLAGDEVDNFYQRLQAHFDAAIEGFKEDDRQALEWKQDPKTQAYLKALDAIDIKMPDRYLRDPIRQHKLFVLSTQSADEINIQYLCETIMGVSIADLVGPKSLPPDEPSEHDLAWYFKLFSLRGMVEDVERMCFFTFLQKTDETFDSE